MKKSHNRTIVITAESQYYVQWSSPQSLCLNQIKTINYNIALLPVFEKIPLNNSVFIIPATWKLDKQRGKEGKQWGESCLETII